MAVTPAGMIFGFEPPRCSNEDIISVGADPIAELGRELRAAIPLARMWANQSRIGEARAMLAGIQRQFTEGFWTADLTTASKILTELNETSFRTLEA